MARTKKTANTGETFGRALVDLPMLGAKSGDYLTLPDDIANALIVSGSFDPNAQQVDETDK